MPIATKATPGEIRSLYVSPDGAHIIVASVDGLTSHVAATGEFCVKISYEHELLQYSGNEALLVKAGQLFKWNFHDKPVRVRAFPIEIPEEECFVVSNSGDRCCLVDYNVLRMVDARSGETLWEEELDVPDYDVGPLINDVAFSSDERFVSFGRSYYLEYLQVRGVEDGRTVPMGRCGVYECTAVIPFGKRFMLTMNLRGLLQLWDLEERGAFGARQLHREVRLGVPSANTEFLATLEPSGVVQILKIPRLSLFATVASEELLSDRVRPSGKPTCLASSDGRTWYVGTSEGEVICFSLSQHIKVLETNT